MKIYHKILVLFLVLPFFATSQVRKSRYKYEIIGGIGMTNFLGDLGGADRVGTHLLRDYEFRSTRPSIMAGFRYKTSPFYALKGGIYFGMVSGNDALTKEPFRQNRNLNFRSPILEISAQIEGYITKDKAKRVYKIRGVKGLKKLNIGIYAFTGIGGFFYMPQGYLNGKWYNLRKMNTEGQGLPGGAKKYSNFGLAIPVGLGFKYAVNRQWNVGMELGIRKTFTDYIDDVSTSYYDKAAIAAAYGQTAADLSDPNLGLIPGYSSPAGDGTAAQRGQPKYKDSYMFVQFNVGYKFMKKRRSRSKF